MLLCWGDINRRFATHQKPTIEQYSPLSYHLAALSNDILAICSVETFVDIRNARTGERIKHWKLPRSGIICRSIAFSPNGQYLAIGLDSGDIYVYQAGLILDFAAQAIHVRYKINMAIGSIVFSHDSLLMAVCTKDNVIRAYRPDNLSYGNFVEFVEPAVYGKHSKTADIADVGLYSHLSILGLTVTVFLILNPCTSLSSTSLHIQPSFQESRLLAKTKNSKLSQMSNRNLKDIG